MREIGTSRQPAATAKAGFACGTVVSALADPTARLGSPIEYRCPSAEVRHLTSNLADSSEGVPMM